MNYLVIFGAGAIPLIVGTLWYSNKIGFGHAWLKQSGLTVEDTERDFNPLKIFGLTYLFGVFLAVAMMPMTIHQMGLTSMLMDMPALKDTTSETSKALAYLMENHGQNYRSFKHGAFHGLLSSIFLVLPVIGITALFERRSFKYIFIHLGYFAITFALIGGVVCQFLKLG